MKAKHLQKKGNVWYFRRRVPSDVRALYPKRKAELFFSLGTSNDVEAARLAHSFALQQDAMWRAHREGRLPVGPEAVAAGRAMLEAYGLKPGQADEYRRVGIEPEDFLNRLSLLSGGEEGQIDYEDLPPGAAFAADLFFGNKKNVPFLSEAVQLHQEVCGELAGSKGSVSRWRAVNRFVEFAGDRPISGYTREQARDFLKLLLSRGVKTTTAKRYLNYISPVFATCIRENELDIKNVFESLRVPGLGQDAKKVEVLDQRELRTLYAFCVEKDDDIRWLIALLADTGMRLAEGCGLKPEDINLSSPVPFVDVMVHEGRRLKTAASVRAVPLVGSALWAAKRIHSTSQFGEYVFERYIGKDDQTVRAKSASNTLRQNYQSIGLVGKNNQSLRHSMRDRLRNRNAPEELIDRIGGWSLKSVGQRYGHGHSLEVRRDWMQKIVDQSFWDGV
ncbi:phage integrase family protein [Maritimibacter alkaliphilus HTCC2654]|nr:phage integrase family protein [Maritimibacter alkaliphilus HTCC2654]